VYSGNKSISDVAPAFNVSGTPSCVATDNAIRIQKREEGLTDLTIYFWNEKAGVSPGALQGKLPCCYDAN
jgi:hypothetical protein